MTGADGAGAGGGESDDADDAGAGGGDDAEADDAGAGGADDAGAGGADGALPPHRTLGCLAKGLLVSTYPALRFLVGTINARNQK